MQCSHEIFLEIADVGFLMFLFDKHHLVGRIPTLRWDYVGFSLAALLAIQFVIGNSLLMIEIEHWKTDAYLSKLFSI